MSKKIVKLPFQTFPAYIAFIAIVLFGSLIYFNSLQGTFHFDDIVYVEKYSDIRQINNIGVFFNRQNHETRLLPFYSFALNYHFHELDVFGYHLVNLIIHLINALLVWWLVRLTILTPSLEGHEIRKYKDALALATALIFLSHPVQTQAVTYITQRFASLATLFYLLSLGLYVKGRLSHRKAYLIGSGIAAVLGMFSKEIVFTLPFIVLIFENYFLKDLKGKPLKPLLPMKYVVGVGVALLLIVPILFSFDLELIFGHRMESGSHLGDIITPGTYLLTQFRVVLTYLRLVFLPIHQNLDYDFPVSKSLWEIPTLFGFLIIVGLLVLSIWWKRRDRLVSFAGVWFFLTLMVESSFIPIQHVIFEHRLYLPMVGVSLMISLVLWKLIKEGKIWFITCCVLVAIYGVLTFERNKVWENEITLWSDVVKKSPNKPRPYYNLGLAYLMKDDTDAALKYFSQAIVLNPQYADAYNNRGATYLNRGQYELALADFERAIKYNPNGAEAYNNRGAVYLKQKKFDMAMADFNQSLANNPRYFEAYNNRGVIYFYSNQFDKALIEFNKSLNLNPKYAEAYYNRGSMLMNQGKIAQAIADFDLAIKNNPKHFKAYNNRGLSNIRLGNYDAALNDFDRTVLIDPRFVEAYNNRATVYSMINKFDIAQREFERAAKVEPNNFKSYAGLAGIAVKKKEYLNALKFYTKAIELRPDINKLYEFRSQVYESLGDHKKAHEDLIRSKASIPNKSE